MTVTVINGEVTVENIIEERNARRLSAEIAAGCAGVPATGRFPPEGNDSRV
ncbi:MAG: hypothetical protein WEF99_06645 [Thermoanaerobaculia bacterium]